jgi:hypothetical protein
MRKLVMVAGVFLVVTGASANAAMSNVVEARVPFPFLVNGKVFPAGQYMVERDASVVVIRGEDGNHSAAIALTTPTGGQEPAGAVPALTFKRYENQYRLSTIWESRSQGEDVMSR